MNFTALKDLFLVSLLFHLAETATADADPGTLTTLPPAFPTGNNSDPCAFSDRDTLIDRVGSDWQNYNISLLVQTCENVCVYVYGAGNPDVSGIGAMISYLIQALATFVFGPMLSTILVICDPDRFQPPYFRLSRQHWLAQIGVNLAGSIHRTNILIALSILLSATIRIQQVAPLAEVQFLDTLALYELYLAYSSMFLSLPISPTALKGWGSLAVYYFIILVLMFRMTFMRKFPNQNSTAMEEITRHCAIQKDYHLPDFISTTRTEEDPQLRRLQTRLKVLVPIGMILLVGLVALKWLRRPILKLYMRLSVPFKLLRNPFSSLGRLYLELCSFIRIDKNLLLIVAACVTMSGVWMFFAISTAQTLQNQRILMQKLSGDAYQDNQWGFGQIMAVLVWAQFVEQLVHAIFSISKHVYKHRRVRQQDRVLAETAAFRISSPPHEANIADHTIASISEEAGPLTEDYTSIAPNFSQQTIPTQQWNETDGSTSSIRSRTTWPRNTDETYLPTRSTDT